MARHCAVLSGTADELFGGSAESATALLQRLGTDSTAREGRSRHSTRHASPAAGLRPAARGARLLGRPALTALSVTAVGAAAVTFTGQFAAIAPGGATAALSDASLSDVGLSDAGLSNASGSESGAAPTSSAAPSGTPSLTGPLPAVGGPTAGPTAAALAAGLSAVQVPNLVDEVTATARALTAKRAKAASDEVASDKAAHKPDDGSDDKDDKKSDSRSDKKSDDKADDSSAEKDKDRAEKKARDKADERDAEKAGDSASKGSGAGGQALSAAMSKIGKPYAWGAVGPNAFDCSGLVKWAFQQAGRSLPRTSAAQSRAGTPVSKGELRPGDLVFFYSPVSHVGIYAGNGKVVNATQSGRPVQVTNLAYMPFHSARRL